MIAILPKIQGKKVFFIWRVWLQSNTFEEELEQEEVTAENWNGGYDEDGNYTGDGEYDEDGNYVGENRRLLLRKQLRTGMAVMMRKGLYRSRWYDESGNYVGPEAYTGISGCGI